MNSFHVCFFNRSYHPDFGATGQLLTELAEDLVSAYDCRVSVVAGLPLRRHQDKILPRRRFPFEKQIHNGVQIFRAAGTTFSPRKFTARAANYVSYFVSACLAGFWVGRPDVVVALTDPPIIGLAAYLTARRSGAAFVFVCQDVFPEVAALLEDFQGARICHWLDRINRFLVKKADRIVALGETMKERLITLKGADARKVTVIHNWADCNSICPQSKQNGFSVSHGLADRFVVMHSGNLGLSQNLEAVLEAADRLKDIPDIMFALVGDGSKRADLEAKAHSRQMTNVRFFPYQPKDQLKNSFASADVFLISLKEGLAGYIVPSKLYGILAAGRPYVAAVEESCEVAAITRKYHCGLLAAPGDSADLADKISLLYHNRALARRLAANARTAALEFSRPAQVRAHYELCRGLVPGLGRMNHS